MEGRFGRGHCQRLRGASRTSRFRPAATRQSTPPREHKNEPTPRTRKMLQKTVLGNRPGPQIRPGTPRKCQDFLTSPPPPPHTPPWLRPSPDGVLNESSPGGAFVTMFGFGFLRDRRTKEFVASRASCKDMSAPFRIISQGVSATRRGTITNC